MLLDWYNAIALLLLGLRDVDVQDTVSISGCDPHEVSMIWQPQRSPHERLAALLTVHFSTPVLHSATQTLYLQCAREVRNRCASCCVEIE